MAHGELAVAEPGKSVLAIMDGTGDSRHIWDSANPAEVKAAKDMFDSLKADGYTAYRVTGKKGEKGEVMHEFDEKAERVIMAPPVVGG